MHRVTVEFRPLLRISKYGWENNLTQIESASLQGGSKNDYITLHIIVFVLSCFIIFGLIFMIFYKAYCNKYFVHSDTCKKNISFEPGCC